MVPSTKLSFTYPHQIPAFILGFLFLCLTLPTLSAQQIVVQPYLQNAEPTSIIISWETDSLNESIVEWGTSNQSLNQLAIGTFVPSQGSARIHHTLVDSLQPGTLYFYRTKTGIAVSDTFHFRTPPLPASEISTRFVAASDMQIDNSNPTKWNDIVQNGIIDYVQSNFGSNLSDEIAFMLLPGDLVAHGPTYSQWQNDFFNPAHPLYAYVPVYPVLGNHEVNSPFYFDYFELPKNGTPGFEEHWWYKDYSNIRLIGLNSNPPYDSLNQLNWLDSLLTATCSNSDIDFVFAELHHPHQSELWPPGESDFTGEVQTLLENFSSNCSKPSIHFFGHTHGYARGQSRDHTHLMVNVATGGGYIDYWGDYSQIDYQDYTKSQDEYGFVIVEVQAGGSPHFTLKRISRGDKFVTLPNQLRDSITVYKHNLPPNTPTPVFPVNQMVNPDCITLEAAPYSESEGDLHMASQWQVSASCLDFSVPVYEAFRNHENWFNETNTQAGDVLTDERVHDLPANSSLCWRVRFRDHSLGWSPWSGPTAFSTGASSLTSNLLQNPGAENDTLGWVTTTGFLEALTSGQCAGVPPHTGLKYFAVGALCNSAAYAEAFQAVDVSSSAAQIDSSLAFAHWGGWLRNWNGADLPAFFLKFYDGNMLVLDSTSRVSSLSSTWKLFKNVSSIPPQTRYIHFILTGSRNSGLDNDAYLDDLYLNLNLNGCQSFSVTVEPPFRKQAEMRISPNPLLDAAKIEVAVPAGQKWEASLFDIQGKIVQQLAGDNCSNIKVLRNGLPAGTYTLKVKIAQRTWLRKLIMLD